MCIISSIRLKSIRLDIPTSQSTWMLNNPIRSWRAYACTKPLIRILTYAQLSILPESTGGRDRSSPGAVNKGLRRCTSQVIPPRLVCSLCTRHFIFLLFCVWDFSVYLCIYVAQFYFAESAAPCLQLAEERLPAVKVEMCHVDIEQTCTIRKILPQLGRHERSERVHGRMGIIHSSSS